MKNFFSYQLSKQLYHSVTEIAWPTQAFRDQSHRAALSIVLNLAEGYGKRTERDRRRFYHITMGSLRELQACLDLTENRQAAQTANHLGACLFRLIRNPGRFP